MLTLTSGYDRTKKTERTFRPMTVEEAKSLRTGSEVFFDHGGVWRRAKVNGKPRTWKRDAARVEVPLKYGLYDFFTATNRTDGTMAFLLVEVA